MTSEGRSRLGIGDGVLRGGERFTVVGVSGTTVLLADRTGQVDKTALSVLLAEDGFAFADSPGPRPVPALGSLEGFAPEAVERARWWEQHILDVLHPQYGEGGGALGAREAAKAAELSAAGHTVSARTVRRRRERYEAAGVVGLVDRRANKQMPAFGRVDERVVTALREAIGEAEQASSRTVGFFIWRAKELLEAQHGQGEVRLPSRRTWYRLFAELSAGLHTTGSAGTRRSVASRPPGAFGQVMACAPGELMQIDSTALDVLVLLADGVIGKCELTGMVDVATRTVAAAVLRPSTKAVDACLLLARTVTPEPMRPGWSQALAMSRSVLPWRRLTCLDERLEHAAARPVMVPATIVIDHGKVFVSAAFKDACRFLGINVQPSRKGTPTDKGHIESMLGSVATLFAQFVAGYTGSNPDRRGRGLERERLWSLPELQDLLDEWVVAAWQNRRHDALRDPSAPGRMFTPNERYAALVEAAGYVPVAMSGADYVELLPTVWRSVNAYGIKIGHRTYDGPELDSLRHQSSGAGRRRDQWEVHHDPYDVSRIWVRAPDCGGWITVFWKHLRVGAAPFGEVAWNHVAAGMPGAGEDQIADAVADLLRRAHAGPADDGLDRRSRRIAARTRAAAPIPGVEEILPGADDAGAEQTPPDGETASASAPVPFEFFDPWQEASRRW